MFDLAFTELLVVAVVALIVLGPERLPKAARFTGLWVRRARAQWYSVKSELENELADEELKRSLRQTRDDLHEARDSLRRGSSGLRDEFRNLDPDRAAQARDDAARSAGQPAPQVDPYVPPAPHPDDQTDTGEASQRRPSATGRDDA